LLSFSVSKLPRIGVVLLDVDPLADFTTLYNDFEFLYQTDRAFFYDDLILNIQKIKTPLTQDECVRISLEWERWSDGGADACCFTVIVSPDFAHAGSLAAHLEEFVPQRYVCTQASVDDAIAWISDSRRLYLSLRA
jgi:hypothetical protein